MRWLLEGNDRCSTAILWCIFFILVFPSAVEAVVNKCSGKPASLQSRARWRTVAPWSLFTLVGIDSLIPTVMESQSSSLHMSCCTTLKTHFCASSREQCQKTTGSGAVYSTCTRSCTPVFELLSSRMEKKNLALMMQMIDHIFIVELIHLELVTLRLINPVIQLSFLIFISMYSL